MPAAERVLNQRELNRALLARQLLLQRADITIPRALERMAGLQAQYAPSMYIGLWTRLECFQRADLDRALEKRTVVQGTMMRSTIHLVSARDYWPFAVAIREARRAWWLRSRPDADADSLTAAVTKLRRHLRQAGGSQRAKEIEQAVGTPIMAFNQWTDLVRVPPSGTWDRRRADLYALAEDWIGRPTVANKDEAVEHLVRRYLAGFGPATPKEIANWAGVEPATVAPALERMKLRRFRSEDGAELIDLPRAPLPDADTPAPVRFLPVWDATLLVHARRTGVLAEEHRPMLFNSKNPHSAHTFLVDGVVAGTWRHEGGRTVLDPFRSLAKRTRVELDDEGERLAALHDGAAT